MIKEFKNNESRDTGIINRGMLNQVKKLYMEDKDKAGELAISLMELVLTGEHSSDDFIIDLILTNHIEITEKNRKKWESSKETKVQNRIENLKLKEIAELLKQGHTQAQIAQKLEVTPGCISKRVSIIRTEFPSMLEEEGAFQDFQNFQDVNINVNANDNVNANVNYAKETNVSSASSPSAAGRIGFRF